MANIYDTAYAAGVAGEGSDNMPIGGAHGFADVGDNWLVWARGWNAGRVDTEEEGRMEEAAYGESRSLYGDD